MRIICYVAALYLLAACTDNPAKKLPILGQRHPVSKVVDGKTVIDTIYQTIPSFTFLNQDSVAINDHTLDNSVYIANFFFTSCPSICPTMQRNLLKVYQKYKGRKDVRFISHSIDFKYDTPSRLKKYADKLGVEGTQWEFAAGSKQSIYGLAEKYMVFATEDANIPGGYDHSGYLILVDKDKHIRGAYDGTNEDQVNLLQKDLATLLKEYQ
ncbi:protein SCO1/2 [bacterium A37T11]|nr:protein SCO1/2 [bacterium A37T11]